MREKIRLHGLNWQVASAGTESYHIGEAPHRFSQKVCLANGIDISGQRARKLLRSDFAQFDRIYAFADDVYREMRRIAAGADMSNADYFLNELQPGSNGSVPDPYYGNEEGYAHVFELINKACDAIIAKYHFEHHQMAHQ